MKPSLQTSPNTELVCEKCGRYGAVEIGEHVLCVDCYENAGSCCLEFGGDDLWQFDPSGAPRENSKPHNPGQ